MGYQNCNEVLPNTKDILQTHRSQLEELARALMEKEVIYQAEIERIMKKETHRASPSLGSTRD